MTIEQVTTRDTQLENQRIHKLQLSLTNFANTAEPAIAAGGVMEVGGSLFMFTSEEAITGWAGIGNDTDCYIKLVVGAPMTVAFTTDPPTWSASKQGWYDGIHRYIGGLHRGATAADYEGKWLYQQSQDNNDGHRILGDGTFQIDELEVTGKTTLTGGVLSSAARVLTGTDLTGDDIFDFLSPVMAVGEYMKVNATMGIKIDANQMFTGSMVLAHRQSSTVIGFFGAMGGISGSTGLAYTKLFEDGPGVGDGAAISGNALVWPFGGGVLECVIAITY